MQFLQHFYKTMKSPKGLTF